ncbi:uncharacterized protein LOC119562327 [Drosophila subpulchrella]|uniref:uncharacterized protein LOC119562327 n=1 Tax=Drosophila subpulchrella TaxID=1486046 RepID=UPI0018A194F5|nr:uncharacterized protein LOC119562327 [Drosophila subpulchrella]
MEGKKAIVNNTRTAGGMLRWTTRMEVLLIDIWQENIVQLRGARKNVHIYMEMATTLMETGLDVSYKDVRTKTENLTKKHRQEKYKMGPSGGAPSAWQHYELLHTFLGAYRIHNMEQNTLENENTREYFVELLDVDPDDREASICSGSQRSGSTAKRVKVDHKSELVEIARKRLEE